MIFNSSQWISLKNENEQDKRSLSTPVISEHERHFNMPTGEFSDGRHDNCSGRSRDLQSHPGHNDVPIILVAGV
jgi:hypothetical protein